MAKQQGPSDEAVDRAINTLFSDALEDMEERGLEVNPDTLSQFAKEHSDLPINSIDAALWLREQHG